MHKHIDVKLLLDLDNLADFFLDGTDVFLLRDPATSHFISTTKKKNEDMTVIISMEALTSLPCTHGGPS